MYNRENIQKSVFLKVLVAKKKLPAYIFFRYKFSLQEINKLGKREKSVALHSSCHPSVICRPVIHTT